MSDIPIGGNGFDRCISWMTNWLSPRLSGSNERYILDQDMKSAAAELSQLRADLQTAQERIAAQAAQLEQARLVLCDVEEPELSTLSGVLREMKNIIDPEETHWMKWIDKQAEAIEAWLAANAPQPAPQEQGDDLPFGEM